MEANEAPEKIYVHIKDKPCEITFSEVIEKECSNIEYTRTDAFIEKAWDWIEDNILSSNQQDKSCSYFEQFQNYMKGE
jgi:hypothetical protein